MNVLSLFDGISCGRQALERAGIKVDNYFASEIDKYAIQVTMANYPDTKQLGSVVNVDGHSLPKIDLLIGGSPCQSFSFAGKRKGMSTKDEQEILTLERYLELKSEGYEFEGQSYLFWEYMRLLNEVKPKYFLLENVMMGEKWEKVLSKAIGVKPIEINSALVSAQNRRRLYWFGQIRERIFFNDNFCYICFNEKENRRIQGESQDKRSAEILGQTQGGQGYLQNLQSGILKDKQEGNNENLFNNLPIKSEKTERQESESRKKESNIQDLFREEQGEIVAISKGLQKDSEGQRNCEKSGRESTKKNSKNNENSFTQRVDWSKEEANKRAADYHIKYGKEMCCMQCGKKLDYRPYSSIIERGDKSNYKSSSALSEVQFNEARQNNGRIFDILEIGIKGIDSIFGETIINIQQPKDKGILLKDILEPEVDEKYFLSEKMLKGFEKHNETHIKKGTGFIFAPTEGDKKATCLRANAALCPTDNTIITNNKRLNETIELHKDNLEHGTLIDSYNKAIHKDKSITISTRVRESNSTHIVHNLQKRDPNIPSIQKNKNAVGSGLLSRTDDKTYCLDTSKTNAVEIIGLTEVRTEEAKKIRKQTGTNPKRAKELVERNDNKTGALLTSLTNDNLLKINNSRIRRLTPIECERLQTVKDNYTNHVSDSQRYKMLGNGWTVSVVSHIFSYIK